MATNFEQLRREAYDRGRRDCFNAHKEAEVQAVVDRSDPAVFKLNPYQNNHATDERESWEEGWQDEEESMGGA